MKPLSATQNQSIEWKIEEDQIERFMCAEMNIYIGILKMKLFINLLDLGNQNKHAMLIISLVRL